MNILITGAAGFIGSHLVEALLPKVDFLVGIDNLETGRDQNLEDSLKDKRFHYAYCDIAIRGPLFKTIFKLATWDVIIHCAASYKDPNNWGRDIEVNCLGTSNLLELCRDELFSGRLIYLQTSLCYGLNPKTPIKIDNVINPAPNSYAITKTTAEQLIAMSGIPFVSFRLANCYGPRNLSGPIPVFFRNIVTGKSSYIVDSRRDFIYISDLTKLLVSCVEGKGTKNYYHASTGSNVSMVEIHRRMLSILGDDKYPGISVIGKIVERKKEGAPTILLDPSETEKDFGGWRADTSLQIGLENAIEWYRKNEVVEAYSHLRIK